MVKTANIPAVRIVSTRHVTDLTENVYPGVTRGFMEKGVIKVNVFVFLKHSIYFRILFLYVFLIFLSKFSFIL